MEIKGLVIYAAEGKKIAPVGSKYAEDFGSAFTLLKGQTEADFIEVPIDQLPASEDSELEAARQQKLTELDSYDKSSAVNEFSYKGTPMWLTKEERIVLKDRYQRAKAKGKKEVPLTKDGITISLSPTAGLKLLDMVSEYADACYDRTAKSAQIIMGLETKEEIAAFDITEGYPPKLEL